MKTLTKIGNERSKRTMAAAALTGALAIGALALDVSTASASSPEKTAGPAATSAAASARAESVTMWIWMNGARLRSAPTTSRDNVIDSANAGNGFQADCWTQENFSHEGFIWFHGTIWGGRTGYMRADMFPAPDGPSQRC